MVNITEKIKEYANYKTLMVLKLTPRRIEEEMRRTQSEPF
jgi:hypothetical protein